MNAIPVVLAVLVVSAILLPLYFKARNAHIEAERILAVVKEIGIIDDLIFRMRLDDSENWSTTARAQGLIVRRVSLHEEYSNFLGHHLLRDGVYMNELMTLVVSKK